MLARQSTAQPATLAQMAQVSGEKEFFANLVVDAVLRLDLQTLDLRMIGMKKACAALSASRCWLAACLTPCSSLNSRL
jgi:hypothetical protein